MILHVDMDAFFAAVEQRDNPDLRGKPVVVSGHSKRSVVSTASYEARQYGIHSAMPVFQALRKCPNLIITPGRRQKYARDSRKIMEILARFSPLVEPVSIDEAYLDVTGCEKLLGPPDTIAGSIKETIFRELGLTCSIGGAPVRFMAKVASDMNKPDGLTLISKENMARVIQTLPIQKVPGVGAKAMSAMNALRVHFLGDIRRIDPSVLDRKFGKMGKRLFDLAHGIDPTPVGGKSVRKSISSETTLSEDISDPEMIRNIILDHAQRVGRDLRRKNWICRNVSVKIKFSDFTQVTRSKKTGSWISSSKAIYDQAVLLVQRIQLKKKIRLIGVGVSEFRHRSDPIQMSLLPDASERLNTRWENVDHAVDSVLEKFGNVVQKASLGPENKNGGEFMSETAAFDVRITGRVQGVFFRAETRKAALSFQVDGYVRNMADGSVQALIQGPAERVEQMLAWCRSGSPLSRVDGVTPKSVPVQANLAGFEIRY